MKIGYFGTADFSAKVLEGLLGYKDIEVVFVVSQEDKRVGRKKELRETPVKQLAIKNDILVLQPESLKNDTSIMENAQGVDFFIVVAYGKIIPLHILDIPTHASINLHGSILPKYRGASPIQESIKNGDTQTGLTSMYMSEGMDEGDMLLTEYIQIEDHDTQVDIFDKFESIGPNLLYQTLEKILKNEIERVKQDDDMATYCKKIKKTDGRIIFQEESSVIIYNKHRAYTPWPGIYTHFGDLKFDIISCSIGEVGEKFATGEVVRLEDKQIGIVCLDGKLLILGNIKLEGKKAMNILDFVNGNPNFIGYKCS